MKIRIFGTILLTIIVAWQAFTLTRLPEVPPQAPAHPSTSARDTRPRITRERSGLPALPGDPHSADSHRAYLRELSKLGDAGDQSAATDRWASTLATNESLQAALDALVNATADERAALMGRFGPALLSQWGRIDPKAGLLSWARLGDTDQWLLSSSVMDFQLLPHSEPPSPPQPLLDAWANTRPDDFFAELTDPESIFLSEDVRGTDRKDGMNSLFSTLAAQQPIASLIGYLDAYASREKKSPAVHSEVMTPMVTNQLIMEYGGLDGALEAARSLAETPTRESLIMDLNASRLMRGIKSMGRDAKTGTLDPELAGEIRSSFENSELAGQVQFLSTLRASQWGEDAYPELNPGFVQLRDELEETYRKRPGLTESQLALLPDASERSSIKYLQNENLQSAREQD